MKSNRELRQEAWGIVRGKWFWRLVAVGLLLNFIAQIVSGTLSAAFKRMEIITYTDYLEASIKAASQGLGYTLPRTSDYLNMLGASCFQFFIVYIFGAIMAYGFASAMLKAVRNDEGAWLADSFGGFRNPLGVAWLLFTVNCRIMLWSLLFLIPGIVACYRYRLVWYLKNEQPSLSTVACIDESARRMRGYKWQAFCLDVSYLGWALLVYVAMGAAVIAGMLGGWLGGVLSALLGLGAFYLLLFVAVYFFLGRTVFYKAL